MLRGKQLFHPSLIVISILSSHSGASIQASSHILITNRGINNQDISKWLRKAKVHNDMDPRDMASSEQDFQNSEGTIPSDNLIESNVCSSNMRAANIAAIPTKCLPPWSSSSLQPTLQSAELFLLRKSNHVTPHLRLNTLSKTHPTVLWQAVLSEW